MLSLLANEHGLATEPQSDHLKMSIMNHVRLVHLHSEVICRSTGWNGRFGLYQQDIVAASQNINFDRLINCKRNEAKINHIFKRCL